MTIYRLTPLPRGPARGRLLVAEQVIGSTLAMLRSFAGARGESHEGLVYWAGRCIGLDCYVLSAIRPECHHEPLRVFADELQMGAVARAARSMRLGVVAQVHSHPGDDTRHSDGDDRMIFMPFEGMFSIVVGQYGRGSLALGEGVGVHQFQSGVWTQIPADEESMIVVRSGCEVARG